MTYSHYLLSEDLPDADCQFACNDTYHIFEFHINPFHPFFVLVFAFAFFTPFQSHAFPLSRHVPDHLTHFYGLFSLFTSTQCTKSESIKPTTRPKASPSLPTTTTPTVPTLTSLTSQPSPTGTSGNDDSGASISTGAVVGGIAAGILGLAGIIFAILYFVVSPVYPTPDHSFLLSV